MVVLPLFGIVRPCHAEQCPSCQKMQTRVAVRGLNGDTQGMGSRKRIAVLMVPEMRYRQ